jgi:hypothetical protein
MFEGYKDVYILIDGNYEGSYRKAGFIYSLTEATADELIAEKNAIDPFNLKLTGSIKQADKLLSDFQAGVMKIREDRRLTDEAKREDILGLIASYDIEFEALQQVYSADIAKHLEESKREEGTAALEAKTQYDADKVRQEAGVITSELVMAFDLNEAVTFLESKLQTMDREVAREVLSQFVSIKSTLDKLAGDQVQGVMKVRSLYGKLKQAAAGEQQTNASSKVAMYNAIKDHRSNLTWQWNQQKIVVKRAV